MPVDIEPGDAALPDDVLRIDDDAAREEPNLRLCRVRRDHQSPGLVRLGQHLPDALLHGPVAARLVGELIGDAEQPVTELGCELVAALVALPNEKEVAVVDVRLEAGKHPNRVALPGFVDERPHLGAEVVGQRDHSDPGVAVGGDEVGGELVVAAVVVAVLLVLVFVAVDLEIGQVEAR